MTLSDGSSPCGSDDGRPHDPWVSALTATLVELPLAVILITTARLNAASRPDFPA